MTTDFLYSMYGLGYTDEDHALCLVETLARFGSYIVLTAGRAFHDFRPVLVNALPDRVNVALPIDDLVPNLVTEA